MFRQASTFIAGLAVYTVLAVSSVANGQICIECQWYDVEIEYQGESVPISTLIADMDSGIYNERKEATDTLLGEFEDWLGDHDVDDQPSVIDAIEYQLAPYRDISREVAFRIDYIIQQLREQAELNRLREQWRTWGTPGGLLDPFDPFGDPWGDPFGPWDDPLDPFDPFPFQAW